METNYLKAALMGLLFTMVLIELPACQEGAGVEQRPQAQRVAVDANGGHLKKQGNHVSLNASVAKGLGILHQSHQFFQEAWRIVVKDKSVKVQSVFKETFDLLQSFYDSKGRRKPSEVCTQTKNILNVSGESQDFDTNFSRVDLDIQDCSGKYLNWIASLRMKSSQEFLFYFNPSNLKNGAGVRQAAISLTDRNYIVKCVGRVQEESDTSKVSRIVQLRCEKLGQSVRSDFHIEFEYFNYDVTSPKLLEVKSAVYGADFTTKNKSECEKTVIVPQDLSQKISVQERCETEASKQSPQDLEMDKKNPLLQPESVSENPVSDR